MATIELTNGGIAHVDDEDVHLVRGREWRRANGYVVSGSTRKKTLVLMHRVILGAGDGQDVDHANHDGLDNRRSNIRLCTHAENMRNRKPHANASVPFKGVEYDHAPKKHNKPWRGRIRIDGKRIRSRYCATAAEAAGEYNKLALKHHGEFACLNELVTQ